MIHSNFLVGLGLRSSHANRLLAAVGERNPRPARQYGPGPAGASSSRTLSPIHAVSSARWRPAGSVRDYSMLLSSIICSLIPVRRVDWVLAESHWKWGSGWSRQNRRNTAEKRRTNIQGLSAEAFTLCGAFTHGAARSADQ
jgi:hypothetical protein